MKNIVAAKVRSQLFKGLLKLKLKSNRNCLNILIVVCLFYNYRRYDLKLN